MEFIGTHRLRGAPATAGKRPSVLCCATLANLSATGNRERRADVETTFCGRSDGGIEAWHWAPHWAPHASHKTQHAAGGSGGGIQHSYQVAVAETVILLHPLFLTCRCFNRDGEGIVSKMTVPPTAIILPGRDRLP